MISFLPIHLFYCNSFQFHSYPEIYFIGSLALFLSNFISTQAFISLAPQIYFFSISFPSRGLFHCLPSFISFQFHSHPGVYFISSPDLFHWLPSFISFPFHFYSSTCFIVFSISFLPRDLFHWLPAFISFLFHFYLGIYFIGSPDLFLFNFISTQAFISLAPQPYFFSISFLPRGLFHCLPSFISFPISFLSGVYFIGSLALFLSNFILTHPLVSLAPWLYFFSNFIPTRCLFHWFPSFIFFSILFLPGGLFHWLPSFISFQFHSYPGVYFIS